MKGYRFPALAGAAMMMAAIAGPASAQTPRVVVNDEQVLFRDQQPVQRGGRVYIPLRGVLEQVGAETIEWRPFSKEVFVANDNREILLQIGNPEALVDGQAVPLDAPPILTGWRTLVPLRFLCESLDATVEWEDATRTAFITTEGERVAGRRDEFRLPPDEEFDERIDERIDERLDDRLDEPLEEGLDERDTAPWVRPLRPIPGLRTSSRRPEIAAIIQESGTPAIDYDSVRMRVNGEDVTPELEVGHNAVRYRPVLDLPRGRNVAEIILRERGGRLLRRDWAFLVD